MTIRAFFVLLSLAVALAGWNLEKIKRWWAKGCKACLIQLDLDSTSSSRSWAQAATEHTCWLGRRRYGWRSSGRYSRHS